jgi:phenylalanyl-tRNA synthetase beta chain
MKISYNWLKEYIKTDLPAATIGELLTGCGLEVESIEKYETIKGSLNGLVVGEVKTREKHPDADRLSITTVDIGTGELLNIVCGAANIAAGQKVVVATIGAKLYPTAGEPFEIKKSKIRGQLSEGMICAEDEIGTGISHEGIMVLDADARVGMPVKDYFAKKKGSPSVEEDSIFEIGLTPNRADAASHAGVARDLVAVLNCHNVHETTGTEFSLALQLPSVDNFKIDNTNNVIQVMVEDAAACPRYSGLTISGIHVTESPAWLRNRLKSIGVRPINNIVDITNYVLHEIGQPMHAFDADKIKSNKILVKKLADKTLFKTLEGTERQLSNEDLMICAAAEQPADTAIPMCIAGVFGGADSGISENTKNIFLESAYFNATSIRKSSKRHGLKTDASFRFERGTDPNSTVYALKRAALLIKEIAGGSISSEIVDVYPNKIKDFKVPFSFANCNRLIGKRIDAKIIKTILQSLGITIEHEGQDALLLSIPPFKVDVQREQDIIEEVLRIYGYNKIEIPTSLNSAIQYSEKPDKEKIQNVISGLLSDNGFSEMMCLSLTKSEYTEQLSSLNPARNVTMMNPLSSDLNILRQTLLFSGLETVAYNINRRNADLKLYEFGKTYMTISNGQATNYLETKHLSLFITGQQQSESWNSKNDTANFYTIKGYVKAALERLGLINCSAAEYSGDLFSQGMSLSWNKKTLVEFGVVSKSLLKYMDIKQDVFYADFKWDQIIDSLKKITVMYSEVPKFPEVRRDLALLLDKAIKFEQLEQLAYQSEKSLLKGVNLFDVYEGDKLAAGKKSYALSFTLQDENATLTDKQIEKIMEKLIKTYKEKAGAEIR